MNTKKFCKHCIFIVPLAAAGLFGLSAAVMWLWNFVLPAATGALAITYWQAMALLVLSKILFSGFRHCGKHRKAAFYDRKAPFRDKFLEMNDEEKAAFKQQWKKHCCK